MLDTIFQDTQDVIDGMPTYTLELGKWYFWSQALIDLYGPYDSRQEAEDNFHE